MPHGARDCGGFHVRGVSPPLHEGGLGLRNGGMANGIRGYGFDTNLLTWLEDEARRLSYVCA